MKQKGDTIDGAFMWKAYRVRCDTEETSAGRLHVAVSGRTDAGFVNGALV